VVEKAAELGVRRILPVQTDFTNAERIRRDRLQAHAVEAAEQCGGTSVPEVAELAPLDRLLAGWDPARRIMWCDEGTAGFHGAAVAADPVALTGAGPWAVLVGPEGGFASHELDGFRKLPFCRLAGLGPRILRAETAAVAALAVLQALAGDWRDDHPL
jgi:16S rRNA (uracil1498-N3)-methyltransferase